MKKSYKARIGSPFKRAEAQMVGERLETLMKQNKGKLKPLIIVDDARNKNSPLHKYFEWDDSEAAEKFRLYQAKNITNHIVEVVIIDGKKTEQRSFFNVTDKANGKTKIYVTLEKTLKTPNYRKQLLDKLISSLENGTVLMKLLRSLG